MRLAGSEILGAEALEAEIGRTLALLEAAPSGELVVATANDGALIRAALAAVRGGRTLLTLDPALPAEEAAPLLPQAGLALLDPETAARWALPPGLALRTVASAAKPNAWQRLLGRKAAVETFPGCLEGLSPRVPPRPPRRRQRCACGARAWTARCSGARSSFSAGFWRNQTRLF